MDITTLNNRQYCVVLDPVGEDGKPQLGQKRLVKVSHVLLWLISPPKHISSHVTTLTVSCVGLVLIQGEKSFFLLPGERLMQGIQNVYILGEDEGLILKANEGFEDIDEKEVCQSFD